jgi:hypothetical protein
MIEEKNSISKLFLPLLLFPLLLISCATSVEFQIEHPPLVDLRDVNTITVIPLEWNETGRYGYLANDVTRALTTGIRRSGIYTFVDPAILRGIDKADYGEYVDVYITGQILNVTSDDESETKEETDGDKTETKIYVTRTVTVYIEYKYIRAVNDEVLRLFIKTEKHSVTFDNSPRAKKWWANLLLDIFVPKGPSSEKIAKSAAAKFSQDMKREVVPWTGTEKKRVAKSTGKDKRFKEAQKLVRQKNYFSALVLYKNIYEETGSAVAGYNTALLFQANGQFTDALELLENLDKNIMKTGINSPPFIKNEINNIKKLLNEFEILEDYKS